MDRAAELTRIAEAARSRLDEQHQAREVTIAAARQCIQASAASIRATHRGEFDRARELAVEARDHVAGADAAIAPVGSVRAGPLPDAKKELAEAWITLALVQGDAVPTPEDLGIGAAPYLNGMAEAASELRREVLDRLRDGRLDVAEELLAAMDEIYAVLVTIDYPDAVTGGLRRTTDALRAVLERTRGDLTTTTVATRLQSAIEAERAERDS